MKEAGAHILIAAIHTALRLFEEQQRVLQEKEFFSHLNANNPLMMVLLDKEVRIRRVNSSAYKYITSQRGFSPGVRLGAALNCLNYLNDPRGCGYTRLCEICELRKVVLDTFSDGKNRAHTEVRLPVHSPSDTSTETVFLASTSLNQIEEDQVLVTLEDISAYKKIVERNKKLIEEKEKLLWEVQMTYAEGWEISLYFDIEDIHVTAKQSLPVGIIVNELVTYAYKYAFTEDTEGFIHIKVHRTASNKLEICVIVSHAASQHSKQ